MPYRCQEELSARASAYCQELLKAGFTGCIAPGSFRDCMVKLAVSRDGRLLGLVNLYFSPKNQAFSLRTHELTNQAIVPALMTCWTAGASEGQPGSSETTLAAGHEGYVDGSCVNDGIGYGFVLLKNGQPVAEGSGQVTDAGLQGMRQVGGEIKAVLELVAACQQLGVAEVIIHHDMEGLEKWATGAWQTGTPATSAYAAAAKQWPLGVQWSKVTSHSGNRWNDHVDQLARKAASEAGGPGGAKPDPLTEAVQKASAFVEHLERSGIRARYDGPVNNQFARIVVGTNQGIVDVYNTRKRSLSEPYFQGFKDAGLRSRTEQLWRSWSQGSREAVPVEDGLAEARHYHSILVPYRDCQFDFVDLADALARAYRHLGRPALDSEATRYDFAHLEGLYFDLRGNRE